MYDVMKNDNSVWDRVGNMKAMKKRKLNVKVRQVDGNEFL